MKATLIYLCRPYVLGFLGGLCVGLYVKGYEWGLVGAIVLSLVYYFTDFWRTVRTSKEDNNA